jgi:two-component system, OmpR family, response regulator MprA
MRLLLVEDDVKLVKALQRGLQREGYAVDLAGTGDDALAQAGIYDYDAVVLDVMLPGKDGFAVCRELRRNEQWVPVLMLTARDHVKDRIRGLDAGADDYLVKPFALEELHARLRALLRRAAGTETDVLRFSDVKLDMGTREVRRGERRIELTRTEFLLLELFLRNARQVLTRSVIFDRVWDYDFGPRSNALEVYVSYLRRKLEAGAEPRLIHTVRGVGYVLREQ